MQKPSSQPVTPLQNTLDLGHDCPSCGQAEMSVFYSQPSVPIHSCRLSETQRDALDYPCRPLALGFCDACGFIANVVFDPHIVRYDACYEDRQIYSARFRDYQSELIDRLIRQYKLKNKDILEIGCGGGEFLIELCRKGGNRGVGIDPRCVDHERDSVRFLGESLDITHASLPMDFVCCRHTLEHIHETRRFVTLLREVIGQHRNAHVFFELPDVSRVLRERAFWDIYYEHCSYFVPDTLAGLFESCGFEVVELAIAFDNQYLQLVARPSKMEKRTGPVPSRVVSPLADEVDRFAHEVRETIRSWASRIHQWHQAGLRIAVWGAGSKCVAFLTSTRTADAVQTVVDINPHQQGKFLPGIGHCIRNPQYLAEQPPDVVLVMNPAYLQEIKRTLSAIGVQAEVYAVCTP